MQEEREDGSIIGVDGSDSMAGTRQMLGHFFVCSAYVVQGDEVCVLDKLVSTTSITPCR